MSDTNTTDEPVALPGDGLREGIVDDLRNRLGEGLLEFHIDAVTEGIDAIGEVTVRLKPKNGSIAKRISPQSEMERRRTFGGYGAHSDIIVASARAYIAGLNKLLTASGRFGEAEVQTAIGNQ